MTLRQRGASLLAALCFTMATLSACGGGGGDAASSEPLSIERTKLDLEGDLNGGQVIAEFAYTAPGAAALGLDTSTGVAVPEWINIFYGNGVIRVVAMPSTTTPGVLTAPLRIHAIDATGKSLGFKDLAVTFSIKGMRVLEQQVSYDPTVPGVKTVGLVVNSGSQTWNLVSNVPWLTLSKSTVTGVDTVQMMIDGTGQTGSLWADIAAQRNGQTQFSTRMNLAVTSIVWSMQNSEYTWFPRLVRGWTAPSKVFQLSYTGGNPVPVTITSNVSWLRLPAQVMSNEAFTATIVHDATLGASNNSGTIRLTTVAGTQTLTMQLTVGPTVDQLSLGLTLSNPNPLFLSGSGSAPASQEFTVSRYGSFDSRYPAVVSVEASAPWLVVDAPANLGQVLGGSKVGMSIAPNHGLPVGTHRAQITIRGTSGSYVLTPLVVPVTFIVQ